MMRRILKGLLPKPWLDRLRAFMDGPRRFYVVERHVRMVAEARLREIYQDQLPAGRFRSPLNGHEMRVYSQNGEDGILLFIFSQIGTTNQRFIEFGVSDGTECNCANLAINFGWQGLMMDGSEANVAHARDLYAELLVERANDLHIVQAFVTAENVNACFRERGFEGEIDLLSIDVDGNDYWIWNAIDAIQPRVVVVEYNGIFGWEQAVTIPYDPHYDWSKVDLNLKRTGASLAALTSLGRKKGYTLVGCDAHGVNAFFVRDSLAENVFERLTPQQAYYPLRDRVHGLVLPIPASQFDREYLVDVD